MSADSFPDVRPEPTSHVFSYAKNPEFPAYTVAECDGCGNGAVEYNSRRTLAPVTICRTCRTGKKQLTKQSNYGKNWPAVRAWIIKRDSGTCLRCATYGRPCHVHHIERMVWFETTREAHTPDNLATLCDICHMGISAVQAEWRPNPEALE